jgi:DNA segregation ATPase FtsK/SpoIIIE, S-DNA-T family
VHRPARMVRPAGAADPRTIEAPPTLPEGRSGNPLQALLPVAGATSSLGMMLVFRNPAMLAVGALIMLVTVFGGLAMLLSQSGQAARQRRQQRERYLDYLEELRQELAADEQRARAEALALDPPPAALLDVVRDPARRWERRRADQDFLRLRVGMGQVPARPVVLADDGTSLRPTDRFMRAEARAVERRFATVPQMPLLVPMDRAGNVSLVGDRAGVLGVAQALLVQLAALHAPDDVAVAVACPPERLGDWSWTKWLPHVVDPERRDGQTEARRIAPGLDRLARALADDLGARATYAAEARRGLDARQALALAPRLLVVNDADGGVASELPLPDQAVSAPDMGVTVLHLVTDRLHEPEEVALRVTVEGRRGGPGDRRGSPPVGRQVTVEDLRGARATAVGGVLDEVAPPLAEGLARMLAPLRLSPESVVTDNPHAGPVGLPGLLGIEDPTALDPRRAWGPRSERDFLRVPIGVTDSGEPLLLDLKEPAQLGMGPHGLCVGATGSGKSELLRTLVLALAATHPPDRLGMVLIDYKGGATFAPFAGLPHVAGVITNLADDAGLVERVHASLAGEVQRRQQVLKDAGNLAHVADYAAARETDPELAPLPHLLVIIDEFGELLTAKPEFIELFLTIGRIGRSIGVHLLLSSQRIEGGRLKGLDTYLSYRLGLRTFSAAESQLTLDTPDAFHLPPLPGFGYLKVGTVTYQRFKTAYVSGPHQAVSAAEPAPAGARPGPYPAMPVADPDGGGEEAELPRRSTGPGLHDLVVAQLRGAAEPVHRVWLPPLPAAVTMDAVAGRVEVGGRGLGVEARPGPMRVPLGLLDDPAAQWQGRWVLDLRAGGGHVAVIGSPQSGKTTLLRALVTGLALTHTPREAAVYGVDLVGGGLLPLAAFPHVGGIAGRSDRERVRRTFEEVRGMLDHREQVFRERGIDSVESLRVRHAAGELSELPMAEVVLAVDGLGLLRAEHEELEPLVADLLQRGGGYGIHLVGSLLRWNDLRIALQPAFGTRLELRLNDPSDSATDRRLAATIRDDQPGRVLTGDRLFAQTALPRVDGVPADAGLGQVMGQLAEAARAAWTGEPAPRVRVLPPRLAAASLPGVREAPRRVPVGVDETSLRPLLLDLFDRDQHLLVLGDGECGKTNLLRLVAHGLADRFGAEELVFAVMDPRRGLRDAVPEDHLGGYAGNGKVCGGLAAGIAKELDKRMPEAVDDQQALADGGWFQGPRIVVLVDDYDMLTAAGQQPLAPFLPYVPSARDIGLHFVVARRVAGAARALYDPFLQALRESGTSGLVMAGDRGEGQLFPGVYAGAQPPGRGLWVRRGEPTRLVQTALAGPVPQRVAT